MPATFIQMSVLNWVTQNETSSSWMVAATRYEQDGGGKPVSVSISFTQLVCYIPIMFL